MEIVRQKNVATYIVFPIVDADGDLVTGAAGLDSEIDAWGDGSAPDGFADCTNEATEIGASGIYYLSLTQAEMNNDYIVIQTKTSTVGAKTQVILIRTIVGDPLNLATTGAGTTITVSDLTVTQSDVKALLSDLTVADAVADKISSDLTITDAVADKISSDLIVVQSDVKTVRSDLILGRSDTVVVQSNLTIVDANVDTVKSDLIAIRGADGDTLETLSDQIDGIQGGVATIAPTTDAPDAFAIDAGSVIAGTYVKVQTDDNDRHILAPANPGGLDCTYTFECGTGRAPVAVMINGYWNGSGQYCDLYAYDYVLGIWDKLSNSTTRMPSKTTDVNYSYPLNREHMDITASVGQVKIRFVSASVNTAHRLNVDSLLVATVATLSGSGGGGTPITPQDIWEYATRTLTSAAGEPADTAAIADAVWADSDAVTLASNVVTVQSDLTVKTASISSDVTILPSEIKSLKSDVKAMRDDDVVEIEALILTRAVQAAQVQGKPPGGTVLGPAA